MGWMFPQSAMPHTHHTSVLPVLWQGNHWWIHRFVGGWHSLHEGRGRWSLYHIWKDLGFLYLKEKRKRSPEMSWQNVYDPSWASAFMSCTSESVLWVVNDTHLCFLPCRFLSRMTFLQITSALTETKSIAPFSLTHYLLLCLCYLQLFILMKDHAVSYRAVLLSSTHDCAAVTRCRTLCCWRQR